MFKRFLSGFGVLTCSVLPTGIASAIPTERAAAVIEHDLHRICFQITAEESLDVLSTPSTGGRVVRTLPARARVTVAATYGENWVRIIEPTVGYIPTSYLEICS
ncbi:MAG: SH3 domain-containing protein [Cyanobacteria bacterium J06626_14]